MEPEDKKKRDHNFDPTPDEIKAFIEKQKQSITEEDIKWFENPGELVPFEDVMREIEQFVEELPKDPE